jgi:hypothetical protein
MSTDNRIAKSLRVRIAAALQQAVIPEPPHTANTDEQMYADKCGTYTKGLKQDTPGRVNLAAYKSLKDALASGQFSDFEKIIVGGTTTLNGPQGALAFDLEGADSGQFGDAPSPPNQETVKIVPPAPAVASAAYGTELIELYWASLLRDLPFTRYASDPIAALAAQELSTQPDYQGPRDGAVVTPDLLFRGGFPGETTGPYLSQFFITPTSLGQQPIDQMLKTYVPGLDYMTDMQTWFQVQNGVDTGLKNKLDPQRRYARNGRDLAAYTHIDVLYQAYFTALLVLNTLGVHPNRGNPYRQSKTENGFATLGGPDFAGTLGEVATRALKAVWYQKWCVHLRHRPESGGGIVQLIKTGQGSGVDCVLNNNVLNSDAVRHSFQKNGTYLLSQTFPEGSPTHPAYPTGHGTVGGACITVLKFFFEGDSQIQNPLVPTEDGTKLIPYSGADAKKITVNGELNKLAHNVSFGHGIHAGIHWRSDSDSSIVLGEAVAISFLRDKVLTYNEPLTVKLTKLDGTTATITNQ